MEKIRADLLLVEKGLAPSRERARAMIKAGQVYCDGRMVSKPAETLSTDAQPELRGEILPFVSRGGLKLQKAVEQYAIDLTGCVAMDVGASTGGFTDCMLQAGAVKVYAIDVGRDQLHESLRRDARVVCMEQRNAREMTADWFAETPTFAATDVSFISVRLILPAMHACLADGGRAVILVKPQFEAGRSRIGKNGVVRDAKVHLDVLRETAHFAEALGFGIEALDYSPITGPEGNIEFLMLLKKGTPSVVNIDSAADQVVKAAHIFHR